MPVRAVLFDKDGTFVDFNATWGPAIAYAMADLAGSDVDAFQRLCAANLFDPATQRLDRASPFIAEASADFAARWAQALRLPYSAGFHARMDALLNAGALKHVQPLGDPALVFGQLKSAGYMIGVVTNDTETGARLQAEKLGLLDYCDAILGYDSGHGRKPSSEPLLALADRFGLAPGALAMVGDTLHDLRAGRAAGALTIGVTSEFATADDLGADADHILPDISGLPALLASLRASEGPQGAPRDGQPAAV